MEMKTATLFAIIIFICSLNLGADDRIENKPVAIAGFWDISGSFIKFPQLDSLEFDYLLDYTALRGGTIGVSVICSTSFRPMIRRTFKLDTVSLVGKRLTPRIIAARHNDSAYARFKTVKVEMTGQVLKLINRTERENKTDISGAVERMLMFFSEKTFDHYDKIAIIVSDCCHNVRERIPRLPDHITFMVVGAKVDKAREVFGDNCLVFESFDGLLQYLFLSMQSTQNKVFNAHKLNSGF